MGQSEQKPRIAPDTISIEAEHERGGKTTFKVSAHGRWSVVAVAIIGALWLGYYILKNW